MDVAGEFIRKDRNVMRRLSQYSAFVIVWFGRAPAIAIQLVEAEFAEWLRNRIALDTANRVNEPRPRHGR